jgi:protein-tyrosine-phosphatase
MRIVFLCIENSNRSQMAEAFGRMYAGQVSGLPATFEIFSAGSNPSGKVNPKAIEAMRELGYDMSAHRSKSINDLSGVFDVAVTMGCGDACPAHLAKRRIDWQIPDPKLLSAEDYRQVRNLIGRMVQALLKECAAAG